MFDMANQHFPDPGPFESIILSSLINRLLDGTLTTIEFQREALENAQSNTEILKNMGMASKALKGALGNMDIDKVDDMMADIQESQDVSNEIADAIARPMGFQVIMQIQFPVKGTRILKSLQGFRDQPVRPRFSKFC